MVGDVVWLCERVKLGGGVPMVTAALLWSVVSGMDEQREREQSWRLTDSSRSS